VDVAWEARAQLVNVSLVGPANPLLRRAMDRLDQLGVVVVAAVGNEGTEEPRYPAAYPSVIGVGAVDRNGALYARGNRGPAVEVLAPGVEIVSSVPGDAFAFGDGTSLAAAHVTGVLALAIAASGDPLAARTAFFQVAQERGALPVSVPPVCDVLARLGKPCP
jgi:subtilisin family serine protease